MQQNNIFDLNRTLRPVILAGIALCALMSTGCGSGRSNSSGNNSSSGGALLTRQEFAYVANQDDNTVAQFQIKSDGTLAPLTPATLPVTPNAMQVVVTPNRRFAYVVGQALDTGLAVASQFKINADATLTPLSPATVALGSLLTTPFAPTGSGNANLTKSVRVNIDPQSRFLYAPGPSKIFAFPIGTDGKLGAAQTAAALTSPVQGFVFDPQGGFAYVASQTTAQGALIIPFTVQTDGSLVRLSSHEIPLANVDQTLGLAIDPGGQFLYTTNVTLPDNQGNTSPLLASFKVNTDGTLASAKTVVVNTANPSSNLPQFLQALGMMTFPPAFDTTGKFAYQPTNTPRLMMESLASDGSLNLLSSGSVLAGAATGDASVEPSGLFVYVANQDTSVSQFRRNADGTLSPLATPIVMTGHRPVSIVTIATP